MSQPHVIVIGNNVSDSVFTTRSGLLPDQKVSALSLRNYAGGQAANVAHCLSGLGFSVHYVGVFGDDLAGAINKASLSDCGVSLEGEITVAHCPTQTAVILVDSESGARSIVMYKDERLRLGEENIKAEWIRSAELVYIDNHEPRAALAAARMASGLGIPVLADLEVLGPLTPEILKYVSSLIAPERVLCELTGLSDIEATVRQTQLAGPSTVVATRGAAGALGIRAGEPPVSVPACACKVLDTTGAGDAFHAGYVAAVCAGLDFHEALTAASRFAAAKCEEPGPRLGLSRLAELRQEFFRNGRWQMPARHHLI
jgi:sulfofructose kinase